MRPKQFKEMFLSAFSQIKDTCDYSDKLQRKIQSWPEGYKTVEEGLRHKQL